MNSKTLLRLIAGVACLAAATGLHAQDHYGANIAIGGKAGVTMSRLAFNPSVPQSMIQGITAGVQFRYVEEKHFGLIAELNVEQRGWKESFDDGQDFSYQRRFTYVQLPILTHIYFGNRHFKGFFNAGPEVGYMISKSTKANFDYANYEQIENFPYQNRHCEQFGLKVKNEFDYGISAGVGVEWMLSQKHALNLEGRFYYGLNDVFSDHKKDPFSASNAMSIMVTLGYFYRIK